MRFRFQYRRYRLPFRTWVRTAHGIWAEREGVIVRMEDARERREPGADSRSLNVGFGEAAPVPGFGLESVDEIEAACREIGEWVEEERLAERVAGLACLRNAVVAAQGAASDKGHVTSDEKSSAAALGVAALLPAGKAALAVIEPKADIGFRVFKWKVGVGGVADEMALLDDVCARLPSGAMLRLDANGAWDRRKAERWLERCAERPVEFVEQPCFAEASQGTARQKKADDVLLGLAGDFPTKIALDESLVGDGDVERWIGAGWPGIFVVKPSLFADVTGVMARLEKAKADVVFSSALETAVGAKAALRTAFAWAENLTGAASSSPRPGGDGAPPSIKIRRPVRALGFGVWPLFQDARFDGPHAAPFVRWEDVVRMDATAVWKALGSGGS